MERGNGKIVASLKGRKREGERERERERGSGKIVASLL
jgi:hypothetical protein